MDERFGLPARPVKRIHFVGIGGAGMSGIAQVMLNLGYRVSGSDLASNHSTQQLVTLGAAISAEHDENNVADADVVVYSSAIAESNPEIVAARAQRIPVVPRAEMLAELMRFRQGVAVAGTHGKTTTTSLIASVLAAAGLDPTYVVGGRLMSVGSNAYLGEGRYLVAEADESDGSFLRLQPVVAVLTNVDADHLGFYDNDFSKLVQAFTDFMNRVPFYGLAVVCVDDPVAASLISDIHRPTVSYGQHEAADYRIRAIAPKGSSTSFEVVAPDGDVYALSVPLVGVHNVSNATAAVVLALELGADIQSIAAGLASFSGIARRSNILGEFSIGGKHVTLIDDYGHHPREIDVVMDAFRSAWPERRLVVVFQPHRYSRTAALLDDFANVLSGADALLVLDVYPAGEDPKLGADARELVQAIRHRHLLDPIYIGDDADLMEFLRGQVEDGDNVIFFGAGDIGHRLDALVSRLEEATA